MVEPLYPDLFTLEIVNLLGIQDRPPMVYVVISMVHVITNDICLD